MRLDHLIFEPLHALLGLVLVSVVISEAARADERLWLDAEVNGKEAHLAFDTGASHLLLFQKGAARLGLSFTNAPEDVEPAPGEVPMGRTEECELRIGGRVVRASFGVVAVPEVLWVDFDGVLGWGPIAQNIIKIDASKGTIACLSNIPGEAANWLRFKLKTNSATLRIEALHGGIAVDTGSEEGVALAPDRWRDWKATQTNQPMTLTAYYSPGSDLVVTEEGWAKQLSIDALTMTDVPVREADKGAVALGSTGYQMTLGLAALKRLDIIVDGNGGYAYVHAKETPPPPYEHNRLGAVFTPLDLQSEDLVAHVAEGSPAWVTGIRNGDLLTHIGSLDVTKWRTDPTVLPMSRFWERPPGTKLELTLKRNEKIFKTEVVLRQILPPETPSSVKVSNE